MGVATIDGSSTPLSGWHFVCPCGWTVHGSGEPPTDKVRAHRIVHAMELIQRRRDKS